MADRKFLAMVPPIRSRFRSARWRLVLGGALSAVTLTAMAPAPAAFATPNAQSTPIWSSAHTSTTGCPTSLHVLVPNKSPDYFRLHPQDLVVPGAFNAGGIATARLLNDVATRPMHWLSTVTCRPGHPGKPAPRPVSNDAYYANWSGYVTPQVYGYIGATMEWDVRPVTNTTNTTAYSSTWPGIGTGTSQADALIQAGIQQEEAVCGSPQTGGFCPAQTNTPWLEIFPQEAEQDITNLPINTGDLVGAIAEYDPMSAQAYFEIDDLTTSTGVYMYQDVAPDANGVVGSGSQAEWVVERPTVCNPFCSYSPLVNFGTQPVASADAASGLWSQPTYSQAGDDSPIPIHMTSCSGSQTLANPDGISGENFSVTWQSYGTWEYCP